MTLNPHSIYRPCTAVIHHGATRNVAVTLDQPTFVEEANLKVSELMR